jgi:RNA polymerase sigma-70 factor (sigma-E family)
MMTGHRRPSSEPTSAAGADEAIDELYREHHGRVVRLAFLLTGDAGVAEEVVQEAYVSVWKSWDRIRDHFAAAAYLRRTVVNLATAWLRRRTLELRHRARRVEDAVQVDPGARIDVLRAVARLPARQRACVALRFFEDMSESQTAEVLRISVGAVKSQTYKALRRLEDVMGGDDVRA